MKNPLGSVFLGIYEIVFHCPYWEKCDCYDPKVCCDAWVMGACGKYRKYLKEETEKEKTP